MHYDYEFMINHFCDLVLFHCLCDMEHEPEANE